MQTKLDRIDAVASNFVGRVSILEGSVNDVTSVSDSDEIERKIAATSKKLDGCLQAFERNLGFRHRVPCLDIVSLGNFWRRRLGYSLERAATSVKRIIAPCLSVSML